MICKLSLEKEVFDFGLWIQRFNWTLSVCLVKVLNHFPFVLVSVLQSVNHLFFFCFKLLYAFFYPLCLSLPLSKFFCVIVLS